MIYFYGKVCYKNQDFIQNNELFGHYLFPGGVG